MRIMIMIMIMIIMIAAHRGGRVSTRRARSSSIAIEVLKP